MGWGRTLFLGDIGNRLDIEDTERDISSIKREVESSFHKDMDQDQKIHTLINENGELKLYLASLVRLLRAKDIITAQELTAMVDQVDASDGKADGKYDGSL
ncbi:MAG: hypothetical protein K9M57_07245 [Phycisphaerae bacterium]|nr:hypothetical protein [Phycisphaerae bacterium]